MLVTIAWLFDGSAVSTASLESRLELRVQFTDLTSGICTILCKKKSIIDCYIN